MASVATVTPGAAFGGLPSTLMPLQPAATRGSAAAAAASTRRRVASRAIAHLRCPHLPGRRAGTAPSRRPAGSRGRSVAAGLPASHGRERTQAARPRPRAHGGPGPSGIDQVNPRSRSGYPSSWQVAAQVLGEEVVMHGDSRHPQSRPRRGEGRNAGDAGAECGRVPSVLPEPAELARVLEPVVRAAGMDLESVRVSPAGRRRLLKLVVDADGGVGLDAIAEVSREVSVRLDASGVMGEVPYTLEVSSPGVDRPLTEPRHWRRAQGRLVSAPLATGDGAAPAARRVPSIQGRILAAGDTAVTLEIDGGQHEFDYDELGPGRVQIEFGRPAGTGAGPGLDRAGPGNGGQGGH